MKPHTVRIVTILRIGDRYKISGADLVQRLPIRAAIRAFENSAHRHAHIHVIGIARIDKYRMQLRTVGGTVARASGPRRAHRMVIEARDAFPVRAAVLAAKQALRRGARVPDPRLAGVSGCEPEHMIEDAARFAFGCFEESRRSPGFGPRFSEIG